MQNLILKRELQDLKKCLGFLIQADGYKDIAADLAARELPLRKTAVPGTEHADLSDSFAGYMGGQFLASLENGRGAFEYIRQRARKAVFHQRLFIPSASVSGQVVAENSSIPVGRYSLSGNGLTPTKVATISISSNEALSEGSEGLDWLASELLEGITAATDKKVVGILKAACTPGTATSDPVVDLRTLLNKVSLTGFSDLAFLISPGLANFLSTYKGGGDALVFPDMSPVGGVLAGVQAVPTVGVAETELLLVDAKGLITGAQDAEISLAESAMIEMDDAPTGASDTPEAATGAVVSCFQADAMALKAVRSFALKVGRPSAVHMLTDINW